MTTAEKIVAHLLGVVPLVVGSVLAQNQAAVFVASSLEVSQRIKGEFQYIVGQQGILPGDRLSIQLPSFWERPQLSNPQSAGYVSVRQPNPALTAWLTLSNMSIEGYEATRGVSVINIAFEGSGILRESDTVVVKLGDEPTATLGLRVNRFSGSQRIYYSLTRPPGPPINFGFVQINVTAGSAKKVVVYVPSKVQVGKHFVVKITTLDDFGNRASDFGGIVNVVNSAGMSLGHVRLEAGYGEISIALANTGVDSLMVTSETGLQAVSNPCLVTVNKEPNIWWGDSHTHSSFSLHGYGYPDELFQYARYTSLLDWVAYTEHDWIYFDNSVLSEQIVNASYDPGRFVSLHGMEWTSRLKDGQNLFGHLTVISPTDRAVAPMNAEIVRNPFSVFDIARREGYLVIINHPLGRYHYDWWFFDPAIVRNAEMVSDAGLGFPSNEDAPEDVTGLPLGEAVVSGHVFGFVGASDDHFSQPGVRTTDFRKTSGITGVIARDLTREGIVSALMARKNYATTGARIILEISVDTFTMGDEVPVSRLEGNVLPLRITCVGTSPLAQLEIVRNGKTVLEYFPRNTAFFETVFQDTVSTLPSSYYARITQTDGEMAWSSPIWIIDDKAEDGSVASGINKGNVITRFNSIPNPSKGFLKLSFHITQPGVARLTIYDILGRPVKSILDWELTAGDHIAWWGGDTEKGGNASTGVYFARLDLPNATKVVRLLITR